MPLPAVTGRMVPFLFALQTISPLPTTAQDRAAAVIDDRQQVTAVDVVVELARSADATTPLKAPADLQLGQFVVLRDDTPVPVVDLERTVEPWTIVVYFDLPLSSTRSVRWAADSLAQRIDVLTDLGKVAIVVADPDPGYALAATTDDDLLDQTLSGLALRAEGGDELLRLREAWLMERQEEANAAVLAAGERDRIQESLDELLAWLLDHPAPNAKRALLLVHGGFDRHPGDFYDAGAEPEPVDLGPAVEAFAHTLAAYGWSVGTLSPPPAPLGAERYGWQRTVETWIDRNRNAKLARAHFERGKVLHEQGRSEAAETALRKAVYHFYNHPKTASEQAAALVLLGDLLDKQGRVFEARETYRRALAFDPGLAPRFPFAEAALREPTAPLQTLADNTRGRMIGDGAALDEFLAALGRRLRLTYQVSGVPDGTLHRLALNSPDRGFVVRGPAWARSGTPPSVAELRLRRLLAGTLEDGTLQVAVPNPIAGATNPQIVFGPSERDPDQTLSRFRISTAERLESGEVFYRHRLWTPPTETDAPESPLEAPLTEIANDTKELAVIVEALDRGQWGGAIVNIR